MEGRPRLKGTAFRQGYAHSTRSWQVPGPPGSVAVQREHWSGRLDARVTPPTVSAKWGAQGGDHLVDLGAVFRGTQGWKKWLLKRLLNHELGAVTASGLFYPTWADVVDSTQLALDLDLETHKIALFTDTITPNFSSDTAYAVAPYDANETSGGSWSAGGVALTSTAVAESVTGSLVWDCADVSVATTTITSAMCGLVYADALAGNNAIFLVDFVTAVSTTNGTFEITWVAPGSGGPFNIDLTP